MKVSSDSLDNFYLFDGTDLGDRNAVTESRREVSHGVEYGEKVFTRTTTGCVESVGSTRLPGMKKTSVTRSMTRRTRLAGPTSLGRRRRRPESRIQNKKIKSNIECIDLSDDESDNEPEDVDIYTARGLV